MGLQQSCLCCLWSFITLICKSINMQQFYQMLHIKAVFQLLCKGPQHSPSPKAASVKTGIIWYICIGILDIYHMYVFSLFLCLWNSPTEIGWNRITNSSRMLFSFHPLFVFLQKCIPLFSLSLAQSFFIPSPLMLHYCALAGLNAHTLSPSLSLSRYLSLALMSEWAHLSWWPPPPLSLSLTPSSLGCVPCFLYSLLPNLFTSFPVSLPFSRSVLFSFFYPLIYFYLLSNLFCLPCLHPLSLSIPPLSF